MWSDPRIKWNKKYFGILLPYLTTRSLKRRCIGYKSIRKVYTRCIHIYRKTNRIILNTQYIQSTRDLPQDYQNLYVYFGYTVHPDFTGQKKAILRNTNAKAYEELM